MPARKFAYKIRFNPATTVAKINAILDAIDANGGFCPCQGEKKPSTKCHCAAFRKSDIGEVCYCGIYVKVAKDAKKKGAK